MCAFLRQRLGSRAAVRGASRRQLDSGILHDCGGFTLTEQLFAIVLVGLLGIVVVAGISVFTRVYADVRDTADTHSVLNNAVVVVCDELRYAGNISPVNGGDLPGYTPVTNSNTGRQITGGLYAFDSPVRNARVCLVNTKEPGDKNVGSIAAQAIIPAEVSASSTSLQYDAVPTGDGSSLVQLLANINDVDITVQISSLAFNAATNTWQVELTAYKNAVWTGDSITSSVYAASTGPISVRALNAA